MLINSHPADRRRMVNELSALLDIPAEYLRSPTYGYRIGHLVVNRDGTITVDEPHTIARIRPLLLERGYILEESQTVARVELPVPVSRTSLRVSAELNCPTVIQMCHLIQILYSRQHIINRMLKTSQLFVELGYASALEDACPDNMVDFLARFEAATDNGQVSGISLSADSITLDIPLENHDPEHIPVYNELLRRLVAMSHSIKRVTLEQHIPDSEKYTARAFLIRLGYNGKAEANARKVLLDHLDGYASFRFDTDMEKHKAKLARQRRENVSRRCT